MVFLYRNLIVHRSTIQSICYVYIYIHIHAHVVQVVLYI